MKRFFNKFFNVCAILLAICLAASFVSCKNDDDDDDDSSVVADDSSVVADVPSVVAVYTYSDDNLTDTYTFYDDNTVTSVVVWREDGHTDSKTGTWTGSLSGTGTITIRTLTNAAFSVSGNTMTINGFAGELTKQQ